MMWRPPEAREGTGIRWAVAHGDVILGEMIWMWRWSGDHISDARSCSKEFLHTLNKPWDLAPLASCTTLKHLNLNQCCELKDLAPHASCTALQHLHLSGCSKLVHLAPLAFCTALRDINLARYSQLTGLASCPALQNLCLHQCGNLEDLAPLAFCTALQHLDLDDCKSLVDLAPLASCTALQVLHLSGRSICVSKDKLAPLASCTSLKKLYLFGCQHSDALAARGGEASLSWASLLGLPNLRVIQGSLPIRGLENYWNKYSVKVSGWHPCNYSV